MTCPDCGTPTMRVKDSETGLEFDIEADHIPQGAPITAGALVFMQDRRGHWYIDDYPMHGASHLYYAHSHTMKEATMSIWDKPELQISEFVTFESFGDSVEGTILEVETKTFPAKDDEPEQTVPQLKLRKPDGNEVTLTASGFKLRGALVKERPNVGDSIKVTYTGKQGRMKLYDVTVTKGTAPAGASAQAPF